MGTRRSEPMLVLFVDLYVARLTTSVTTADVAAALARLGVTCGTNELYDALERNPGLQRADGRWHPRRRRASSDVAVPATRQHATTAGDVPVGVQG